MLNSSPAINGIMGLSVRKRVRNGFSWLATDRKNFSLASYNLSLPAALTLTNEMVPGAVLEVKLDTNVFMCGSSSKFFSITRALSTHLTAHHSGGNFLHSVSDTKSALRAGGFMEKFPKSFQCSVELQVCGIFSTFEGKPQVPMSNRSGQPGDPLRSRIKFLYIFKIAFGPSIPVWLILSQGSPSMPSMKVFLQISCCSMTKKFGFSISCDNQRPFSKLDHQVHLFIFGNPAKRFIV